MNRKVKYIVIAIAFILIIVIGVLAIKHLLDIKETSTNVSTNKDNTIDTNEIVNENSEEVNNVLTDTNHNEENIENESGNLGNSSEKANTPEEKAKKIVMDNWGEDDSVYYSYDGTDSNGAYIICVRDKATTRALYWYYVDINTGDFEIK